MKLDHLTFTTKWVKGADNSEADCLSRNPCSQPTEEDELDKEINVAAANMLNLVHHELFVPAPEISTSLLQPGNANTFQARQDNARKNTKPTNTYLH
jgi:hypothetical protein